ncbi:hypothetical protein TNIN_210111 [Trichonephila inaurata madagascariensis]|uniref:Uncharacterized protein n=1 Tax=Trichonephila inaurata madagascariensis TaxID=2747483 RepID=A0A8X6XM32_9ARAC|nr:hypothetical protein TNIN_210111 [Trichonephila inaurata madagascariensis]
MVTPDRSRLIRHLQIRERFNLHALPPFQPSPLYTSRSILPPSILGGGEQAKDYYKQFVSWASSRHGNEKSMVRPPRERSHDVVGRKAGGGGRISQDAVGRDVRAIEGGIPNGGGIDRDGLGSQFVRFRRLRSQENAKAHFREMKWEGIHCCVSEGNLFSIRVGFDEFSRLWKSSN